MLRSALLGSLVALASGCTFFQTPCDRLAADVCRIPGEEKSCEFLRSAKRANEPLQAVCTELESSARSYAANPKSLIEKGKWFGARALLSSVGFVVEQMMQDPKEKLEAAGVRVREGLEHAGEAVKDAVHEVTR